MEGIFFKNFTLQTIAENCIHIKHLVLVFGNSFTSSYAPDYQRRQDVYMENLHNWIKLNTKMLNKRGKIENCIRDTMGYVCVCRWFEFDKGGTCRGLLMAFCC